ncbi:MAG TPA: segregation/condensation protein A [Candidatus Onthoplasma faecigallinarum]|nr:segregation/condensation protein A [Candidatus Onthoplasma faecigallinarum]
MDNNTEDFVESSPHLTFKLDGFEGPLDLLLHLIKESNMSIMEVKISSITDQYMKYMENINELDMEEATAFLDMTSRLLEIKSRSLLPVEATEEDEEEIDPELQLKMQLQEYQLFKEAGGNLSKIENVDRFYKQPDKSVGDTRIVFNQFNLDKLLDAFAFILMRTKDREGPQEKKISRDRWTVADKIAFLTNILKDNKEINFFSLFDETYSKLEVITVFMAILELLKFQKIEVVQTERYADILIRRKEENDEH